MEYAQLIADSGISANWVMAILLGVAIYYQKRANDKADKREIKIDEILSAVQKQVSAHDIQLAVHEMQLKSGVQVHITKADA